MVLLISRWGGVRAGYTILFGSFVGPGEAVNLRNPVLELVVSMGGARRPGLRAGSTGVALLLIGTSFLVVRSGWSQAQEPEYVGSAVCGGCHEEQYAAWSESTHGTAGGPPGPSTVIAPFDGSPIRFKEAVVTPVVGGDGRFEFRVERPGRPVSTFVVDGVIGRGHMVGGGTQGFVSSFADGTRRFLPFDYSRDLDAWFCNTAFVGGFWVPGADRAGLRADEGWVPINRDLALTECGDWPPARILGTNRRFANCQNCHGSQVSAEYRQDLERYETAVASLDINCESCHGPGGVHVSRARTGVLNDSPDLGIAVLDTLSVDASLGVCFECHALKRALGDQGDGVDVDYSLGLPLVGGDRPLLPDGRIRTFGYQQNHRTSACYLSGSMTCVDCHDPHGQGYQTPKGLALDGRFDDGQCTACHASKAEDPEQHTHHLPGSEGSRCVSCHMPYLQQPALTDAVPYARSDHTIPIPRPGFDERVGVPSACAQCHRDQTVAELADRAESWWGPFKPHRPEVAAGFGARSDAGSAPAAGPSPRVAGLSERYGIAKVMAIDQWMERRVAAGVDPSSGPGTPAAGAGDADPSGAGQAISTAVEALRLLAGDADPDVKAVALAALHVTDGDEPATRALLDEARRNAGDSDALDRRWAAALGQWGAFAGRSAGPASELVFLRRAQEVRPTAAETLTGLAAGLASTGDWTGAVQTYLEALRNHPNDPVALVNLGLGLEVLGRAGEAEAVYERAVAVRPTEAVAHLNLGNMRFQRGELDAAIESYRAAVRYDAGLARAHFYLGVALVNSGRPVEALPSLYNAREFAPDDEEILGVLAEVEAALGR